MRKAIWFLVFLLACALLFGGCSEAWDWACREAFTEQNDIRGDDWAREKTSDPEVFHRWMHKWVASDPRYRRR